jgi:hypothetical protein
MRLWVRIIADGKMKKDVMYSRDGKFDIRRLNDYMVEICGELDLPTPVLLRSHTKNLRDFNTVKFRPDDFVESVDFDALTVENASE